MTTRRLVFHVGVPKTGTTALRMWGPANRDQDDATSRRA
jgi:hypothetical protein